MLFSGVDGRADVFVGINVATRLYPHQKEALTFLLEREKELKAPKSRAGSLWTLRKDTKGRTTWYNIVTQKETRREPVECRGTILADDVSPLLIFWSLVLTGLCVDGSWKDD